MSVCNGNADLAFVAGFTLVAVIVEQFDVNPGHGLSSRAGFGLYPGRGSNHDRRFRLTEPLAQLNACIITPAVKDFRIERFACNIAGAQGRKIVVFKIFFNKEAINRRRGAKCCNMILSNEF